MARKHEPLNFAGSLEVQSQKPLDARARVDLKSDLTDAASFPYAYEGMTVYVVAEKKKYTLIGCDTTVLTNWREEGSGGASVTVDDALSETSTNPVQNRVLHGIFESQRQAMLYMQDEIDANETAIADRYTKAETDGKIAEAMTDVDNEHFHPVTVLPDPQDADETKRPKKNHEYIVIEYEQDGTTIKSETHYLFYGGEYHEKKTTVSLDGYATETFVNGKVTVAKTYADDRVASIKGNNKGVLINERANQDVGGYASLYIGNGVSGEITVEGCNSEHDQVYIQTLYNKGGTDAKIAEEMKKKQDKFTGGAKGSIPAKASDADGDFEWRQLGKDNMIYDVLWEGAPVSAGTLPLSRAITDYDLLVLSMQYSGDHQMPKTFMLNDIVIGTTICGDNMTQAAYLWGVFDDATTFRITGAAGGATIYKVTGIVFSRLDGTIGRWEKIGKWTSNQAGLQLDLTSYSILMLTGEADNWYNSAAVSLEEFRQKGLQCTWQVSTQYRYCRFTGNLETGLFNLELTNMAGAVLYGYKEAAISDADVQRIAAQVPGGGGAVDQTYDATSTNAQSGKAVAEAIAAGGGGSLADIFDYDVPALVDMNGAHDIAKFMSGYLNLPGMATGIGTSRLGYKVPTVTAGAYTWTDGDGEQTASADVTVTFADGSTIDKTLNFKTTKNRWVNAAKGVDGGYIDTGLTLDFAYELFYEGCQPAGSSGAPIGAFTSTAVRTTARLMGNANKMQCMWPGNNEFTNVASGIDFNQMHTATFNANGVELTQGSTTYTGTFSGTASGTDNAPVLIFNEAAESTQRNSVVRKAGVRSGADTLREIVMAKINGEIVGVDIANLTQAEQDEIISEAYSSVNASRIYRPVVGLLEEVTE